jgi:hypothetical protein
MTQFHEGVEHDDELAIPEVRQTATPGRTPGRSGVSPTPTFALLLLPSGKPPQQP